ncbi:hypothetical protein [Phyllobacterium myrsinacearum]|uniref:Uncharacterized protein YodC (DUF2158 family) n=1 Tax=Phyllobacterium myrsinacearum TaxID=28101 RepID=A0A839EW97_9HYPH|nr:hypothetical protein [Phyllobacterium myrsinacearum]MBA8881794.1 uncharacterized protein YodC (DUF2158 family) [Phyllobacterium myrsinacearum]
MSAPISKGDIVTLKYHENAPDMTVQRVDMQGAVVVWFDKKNRLCRDCINENLLARVS